MTFSPTASSHIKLHSGSPVKEGLCVKPAAKPSRPARMIAGKLRRPNSGVDWILFGAVPFVAPTANLYRKAE